MDFFCAMRTIRDVLAGRKEIFVVNEGANTLDRQKHPGHV
jgi:hypothetical protein